MKKLAVIAALVLTSTFAHSAILPTPRPFDHRMTSVKYNPYNVTNIRTGIGTSTLIQLEKGERVIGKEDGLIAGDAQAWGFKIIKNDIYFKPIAHNPDTNLMFSTSKGRTYAFYLTLDDFPHYMVKFEYEKPKKKTGDEKPEIPCFDGDVNYQYEKWGDDELAPGYMWDDGRFTCLKFTDAIELPVIYQVLEDGSESIVQYHMQKNTMVVHGASKEFRLRLDDQVLGLRTKRLQKSRYNEKKTSLKAKRVIKHE